MAPDVSIIVVSRNTRARTLACLDAVRKAPTKVLCELIVVDDKSSDGSPSAIRQRVPEATLLALQEPVGFAEACNLASRHARGRYILLLDAAAIVRDGAIDRLVGFAGCTPDARVWGGRSLAADRSATTLSCAARSTPWHLFCQLSGLADRFNGSAVFNGEAYGGWPRDSVRVVDIVASRFLLIETGLWRQLNGFDQALFMGSEDADLCLRAAKLGATPLITPQAEIFLDDQATPTLDGDRLTCVMAARSALIRKHWSPASRCIGQVLLLVLPVMRWLVARAGNRKAAAAWATVLQMRKAWVGGRRARPVARRWASPATPHHREPVSALPVDTQGIVPMA